MASAAQWERRIIGTRTREALEAKRASGVRLGRPSEIDPAVLLRIKAMREAGQTLQAIADELNEAGVPTARGAPAVEDLQRERGAAGGASRRGGRRGEQLASDLTCSLTSGQPLFTIAISRERAMFSSVIEQRLRQTEQQLRSCRPPPWQTGHPLPCWSMASEWLVSACLGSAVTTTCPSGQRSKLGAGSTARPAECGGVPWSRVQARPSTPREATRPRAPSTSSAEEWRSWQAGGGRTRPRWE